MKKYIESILSGTNMIHTVSSKKTLCSHIMTEFYFFKIFIDSLKTADIKVSVDIEILPHSSTKKVKVKEYITIINSSGESYKKPLDTDKLNKKLTKYNSSISDMSFIESTIELINIFISLL